MPMIRVSKNADNPYVMLNKTPLDDPRLSFKAKGMLTYLLSKPDHWQVRVKDLANHATDGSDAIYSGLKELRVYGYATYEKETDDRGRYLSGGWTIYEVPRRDFPDVEKAEHSNNDCSKREERESDDSRAEPKRKREPSEKDILKSTLTAHFSESTGIPSPPKQTKKECSAAAVTWWTPLCEIAKMCENDIERTKLLIDWTLKHLDERGMTVKSPLSIVGTAVGEQARRQRTNGQPRPCPSNQRGKSYEGYSDGYESGSFATGVGESYLDRKQRLAAAQAGSPSQPVPRVQGAGSGQGC